ATEMSYLFSLASALSMAAIFHLFRRDGRLARERAEAAIELATKQGFPAQLVLRQMVRSWALIEQGEELEGLLHLRQIPRSLLTLCVSAEASQPLTTVQGRYDNFQPEGGAMAEQAPMGGMRRKLAAILSTDVAGYSRL